MKASEGVGSGELTGAERGMHLVLIRRWVNRRMHVGRGMRRSDWRARGKSAISLDRSGGVPKGKTVEKHVNKEAEDSRLQQKALALLGRNAKVLVVYCVSKGRLGCSVWGVYSYLSELTFVRNNQIDSHRNMLWE